MSSDVTSRSYGQPDPFAALDAALELFDPPPPGDPFDGLGFVPNPGPQTVFLDLPDGNIDVLYGGAVGGSKTTSLLMYALRSCVRYPGLQAWWFRRSFPELDQSVLRMLARYNYARVLGGRWDGSKHELRFGNGSILTFAHAKNLQEAAALQSAEINLLLLDERTTIPPDVVDMIYSRIRSGVADVPCLGVRSATNPGNVGHSRVLAEYVEATEYGERVIIDAAGRERRFIQARTSDTPQLGADYARTLAGLPEQLRKAFLDGDWSLFAGQVFREWRYDRHTVDPIPLQASLPRYAGIDDGWTAPWAVAWFAVDGDGRIWVYRERTATQTTSAAQARIILGAEGAADRAYPVEAVVHVADTSMWAGQNSGPTPAQVYAEAGVSLRQASKGPGSRLARKLLLHSLLADGPACRQHRARGWEQCPKLHVFRNCTEIIRTLPALPYDPHRPEDVDSSADDHLYDALTYALFAATGGPSRLQVVRYDQDQPLLGGGDGWTDFDSMTASY